MARVFVPERWQQMIQLIEQQGSASIDEIAQTLEISTATVRRDLDRIQQRGLIIRTRGGAVPAPAGRIGTTLADSKSINPTEKEFIGRIAASLIETGNTVMIDGGYTTFQTAANISATGITVFSNSFDVAQAVARKEGIRLVILGGELDATTGTITGSLAEANIRQFWADKAILGADAVSPDTGLTSRGSITAQTKKAMIECCREIVVVADHSKLGRTSPYRVAPVERITTLVTDDKANESILNDFRSAGVEVIVASIGSFVEPKGA